ncbi:phage tail tape measure protein [Flavicella sp.]|uniref:phage tail tape measure protein n=1 Tax=Flavicella sp. TaxID=2957742 RepID=UPI003017A060
MDAVSIVQGMSSKISKIHPFAALAVGAAAAFALIANDSYKLVKEFEHAMKEVQTISAAAQQDFKGISSDVFSLSKISPDSPKELANAYYQIVSAGYDGAAGLELLEVSAKAAVAGVTDTKTAADGLTTALNSYKISAEKSGEVSDAFFNTVKLGKTTFGELAANISQVAPIASASNIPLNEILSTVASLTKQGVPTAQAMTQIRASIVGLQAAGKMDGTKTLQENMQALYEEMGGNQTLIQKEVGQIEAVQAILAVSGKNARSASQDLKSYNNTAGATARASRIMLEDNTNQWKILENRIKASTVGIGNYFVDMSNVIVGSLNNIIGDGLDTGDKLEKSFDNQRIKVFELKTELGRLDEKSQERKRLLEDMISLYPEFLGGIDTEKVSNQELQDVLDDVNESYKVRYKLAKRQAELNKELQKEVDLDMDLDSEIQKFEELIVRARKFADDNHIVLKVDRQLTNEGLAESLSKQIDAVQKIAAQKGVTPGDRYSDQETADNLKKIKLEKTFPFKAQVRYIGQANQKLNEQKEIVSKINDQNEKALKLDLRSLENRNVAIRTINKSSSSADISKFKDTGFEDVQKAYTERISVLEKIDKIQKVSKKKNLQEYLASENSEIIAAAEEKKNQLEADIDSLSKKEQQAASDRLTAYKDYLNSRKEAYESYIGLVDNATVDQAATFKDTNNLLFDNYQDYLNEKLKAAKTNAERILLIDEGAVTVKREKATTVTGTLIGVKTVNTAIDTTSINALNEQLLALEKEHYAEQNAYKREALAIRIRFKQEEIETAKGTVTQIRKIEENNYDFLKLLGLREVMDRKAVAEENLRTAKELAKKEAALSSNGQATIETRNIVKQREDDLTGLAEVFGNSLAEAMGLVSSGLNEVAALFLKFGEEDMAALAGQLSGVASGIGQIATGDIVGGSLAILNSALTVEVVSDTAKFEEAIADLERISLQISNNITNSVGVDQAKAKLDYLDTIKEKEEELAQAQKAEEEARKEISVLGLKVGSKGSGSGTDQAKLEELAEQSASTKQEIIELKEEYDSFITGMTRNTLSDGIFQGLKDGESYIDAFANTFKDTVGNAVLEAFQRESLDTISQEYLAKLAEYSDNEGGVADGVSDLTEAEIAELEQWLLDEAAKSESEWEATKKIAESLGHDFEGEDSSGLAGSVRSELTEETGSELTGLFRGQYDNGKRLLLLAEQEAVIRVSANTYAKDSERHLSEIATNTANTVIELKLAVVELKEINYNTQTSTSTSTTRDIGL